MTVEEMENGHRANDLIRSIAKRYAEKRANLTEELILNFIETGRNEWQVVERKTENGCAITLERKCNLSVIDMEKRWPKCPPNEAHHVFITKRGEKRGGIGFELDQESIKEIREYLDAVEECMNG